MTVQVVDTSSDIGEGDNLTDNDEPLSDLADNLSDNDEPLPNLADNLSDNDKPLPHLADNLSDNDDQLSDIGDSLSDNDEPLPHLADNLSDNDDQLPDLADKDTLSHPLVRTGDDGGDPESSPVDAKYGYVIKDSTVSKAQSFNETVQTPVSRMTTFVTQRRYCITMVTTKRT